MRTQRRSAALALVASVCVVSAATMIAGAAPPARHESARPPRAGAPEGWWSQVQGDIAASEYEVTWQNRTVLGDVPAAWQAPNRAHNFRTYFTEHGIRVAPRTEATPSWEWGLALVGYGRGGDVWTVAEPSAHPDRNRVEYTRGGIVEWYENAPRGLEQGFVLSRPPGGAGVDSGAPPEATTAPRSPQDSLPGIVRGEGAVFVQLALTGTLDPIISADGQAIDFRTPGGVNVVHFAELRVTDASGRELPAWMEGFAAIGARTIRIAFDDTDAAYPVTIDPLATSPAWTAESNQAYAYFGASVATAGDVNGDGYSDVIVGAPQYDNGQTDEGRVFVYLGSASGLAASPAWTAESNQTDAEFGNSVATAGDVNGDGYSDVIIGAHWYENSQSYEGRAYVYLGSASGLAASPAWTADSDQAGAEFGYVVASAGDVNGDGYADVIVGAPWYDNGQTDVGRAYVYLGSASGLASSPAWTVEGDESGAEFAISVATAGDVNGDGYTDVIVGAPRYNNGLNDEGRAYVYLGSASGLAPSPAWTIDSNSMGADFGCSVATAGDVNGDGYADVIVGAQGYDNAVYQTDEGRAFVYLGSASGLASSPAWTAGTDQWFAYFGVSVATAGDVNGDGYADVIVGAYAYDNGETDEGQAYVYLGSASGLASSPAWTVESNQAGAYFGVSVATAGDVNGDGYSDVIVGADWYDNGQTDEGRAFVYLGSVTGLSVSPEWTAESDQASADFGMSVSTAGDVNGDGYSDVIVGAPFFDNGQTDEGRAYVYLGSASGLSSSPAWTAESNQANAYFGISVSAAGDVNGDGYSDVIVGAPYYSNGQTNEGRAYVYLGSPSGLAFSPAWTAESNQASAYFGRSVATAGDVNGDGYADVIIGAPQYSNGQTYEGRAFVYLGSAAGLASSPAWTAESNQVNANFGRSVATAGDVNGDGYSDVIVGAPLYDNGQTDEGRAYVYLGSASGLASSAAWTAESDQGSADFGYSVSTAGDVNGDGYSDVIVGAYFYDNVETDEGRAYVYLGSAAGLASSPAWTAESDQAYAFFGGSVATAGDVNGDGYSDVIVGAYLYDNGGMTDEGRAYVYLGSASGLGSSAAWTLDSGQAGARLGNSVATAGDVNGDGYADVIVGAPLFDNAQTDEGRALLYYGGGGRGLAFRPQQRRGDDSAPIQQLGQSGSPTSFRLAALGRSPFGGGRIKLEWEVKPLGALFNGTGISSSVSWLDGGAAGAALNELASGLTPGRVYHWRTRVRYDQATTPFAQRSRWFAIPWNGWQEGDLRTGVPAEAGRVPDGSSGLPLLVSRASAGQVTLTWGASCLATDTDYAIYEGTIGSFTSHASRFCSTAGARTMTFSPLAGRQYFLVVPQGGVSEGSYGFTSGGVGAAAGRGGLQASAHRDVPMIQMERDR